MGHDRRFSPRLKGKHRPIFGMAPTGADVALGVVGGNADQVSVSPAVESASSSPARKRQRKASLPSSSDVVGTSAGGSGSIAAVQRTPGSSTSTQRRRSHRLMHGSNPDCDGSNNTAAAPTGSFGAAVGHAVAAVNEDDSSAGLLSLTATGAALLLGARASGKVRKDTTSDRDQHKRVDAALSSAESSLLNKYDGTVAPDSGKPHQFQRDDTAGTSQTCNSKEVGAESEHAAGQDLAIEPLHNLPSRHSGGKEQDASSENREREGLTEFGHAVEPFDVARADPIPKEASLIGGSENTSMKDIVLCPNDCELSAKETPDVSSVDVSFSNKAKPSGVCSMLPSEPFVVAQFKEARIGCADAPVRLSNTVDTIGKVDFALSAREYVHVTSATVGEDPAKIKGKLLIHDDTETILERCDSAPLLEVSYTGDPRLPCDECNMVNVAEIPSNEARTCQPDSIVGNTKIGNSTPQIGHDDGAYRAQQEVQPQYTNSGCLEPAHLPSSTVITDRAVDQKTVAAGESACPGGSEVGLLGMELHLSAVAHSMGAAGIVCPPGETVLSEALMPMEIAIAQESLDIDPASQLQIKTKVDSSADLHACKTANQQARSTTSASHKQFTAMETAAGTLPCSDAVSMHHARSINDHAEVESTVGEMVRRSWTEPSMLHDTTGNDSSSSDELPSILEGNDSPVVFRKDMLVWYKYQKDPFWPAVIESASKAKFTIRFLNYGTPECSKLAISRASARKQLFEYPGSKHSEFTEAGKQYKDPKVFEVAVRHADDYIRGRALQTITAGPCEYFRALYEKPKAEHSAGAAAASLYASSTAQPLLAGRSGCSSVSGGGGKSERSRLAVAVLGGCDSGSPDDAAVMDATQEADSGASSSAETGDDEAAWHDQEEPAPAPVFRYSKETEEIIERRTRYSAGLVEIVRRDKDRLLELMKSVESGAIDSPFKREFQPYSKRLPLAPRGPVDDEDQYMELITYLLELYKTEVLPGCDTSPAVNAVMYVMLPEVVVHALIEKEGISRAEALSIFQAGIKYTDEELLRPIEIRLNPSHTQRPTEKEHAA